MSQLASSDPGTCGMFAVIPEARLVPDAVAQRLRDLGDLYRLAQSLSEARVLGPVADFPLTPPHVVPAQGAREPTLSQPVAPSLTGDDTPE